MPFINDKLEYLAKQAASHAPIEDAAADRPDDKKFKTRFVFRVDEVMARMRSRIYGQDKALESIENMLKIVRADISDPDKPLFVSLFMGPTGVGKTEIVRVLSEAIYGHRDNFCRVDMNTLSLDHYAAAITGSPPGYVGSREGSTILDKEKIEGSFSRPGIILFDEIEKASPQVIQTLLNIFDNGKMAIASGEETIDFRNCLIFMTSNLGAKEVYDYLDRGIFFHIRHFFTLFRSGEYDSVLDQITKKNLEKTFKPEFINRIDEIITFNRLEKNNLTEIIDAYLGQINKRLEKHNCSLQLDAGAKQFVLDKGFDVRYGARALKRALRQYVELPLSDHLIRSGGTGQPYQYVGYVENNRIRIVQTTA
ncbi:AAA family ATPase [Ferviditalea candida]|uniref:AAA family ATPase n=1 Tax=Ferviditalea candida TaxID=3108399 RepID=A0ABU5ZLZ1_9BACL|nr:AAA family ATPase [Paenibacillaceae bacterium T2]